MNFTCGVKLVDFGSLKALVSVQLEGIEIRGFKVIDQGDGLAWVGMPSREVLKNGKKEYYDIVRFPDDESRKQFCARILEEYGKLAEPERPVKKQARCSR